jgi:hypothetical protein
MSGIHGLVAQAALVLVLVVVVASIVLVAAGRMPGPRFLGAPILAFLALALTGLAGIVTLAVDGPPQDGLHVLYGVLAIAGLPIVLVVSNSTEGRGRAASWVIGGGIVTILVLRLFQTGG